MAEQSEPVELVCPRWEFYRVIRPTEAVWVVEDQDQEYDAYPQRAEAQRRAEEVLGVRPESWQRMNGKPGWVGATAAGARILVRKRPRPMPDRWVVPAGERLAPYDPRDVEDLAAQFAQVHRAGVNGAEAALLRFYERFGLLGQTVLEGRPLRLTLDGRLQLAEGDQLIWAWRHAETVHLAWLLRAALERRQWKHLRRHLERVAEVQGRRRIRAPEAQVGELQGGRVVLSPDAQGLAEFEGRRRSLLIATVAPPWVTEGSFSVARALHEASEPIVAKRLLSELVTPNLAGVHRVIDPRTGSGAYRFTALIQVIYWQLADAAGTGRARQCRECGAPFFARDPRQECCPPTTGRESSCTKRRRMRRLRRMWRRGAARP